MLPYTSVIPLDLVKIICFRPVLLRIVPFPTPEFYSLWCCQNTGFALKTQDGLGNHLGTSLSIYVLISFFSRACGTTCTCLVWCCRPLGCSPQENRSLFLPSSSCSIASAAGQHLVCPHTQAGWGDCSVPAQPGTLLPPGRVPKPLSFTRCAKCRSLLL